MNFTSNIYQLKEKEGGGGDSQQFSKAFLILLHIP